MLQMKQANKQTKNPTHFLISFPFCFTIEDKIWTVVQHNNTELTHVHGFDPRKPYTMNFSYNSSGDQLEAITNNAEYCEQETIYHCKKSRLLNSPSKCHLLKSFWGFVFIFIVLVSVIQQYTYSQIRSNN